MDHSTLKEFEALLTEEHNKLVGELKNFASPDKKMPGDWDAKYPKFEIGESGSHASLEEEADEVEEYETRLEAEHSLESRLLLVNRARERIASNGYGLCLRCGKQIPLDRLRANPAAEYDMGHEPKS